MTTILDSLHSFQEKALRGRFCCRRQNDRGVIAGTHFRLKVDDSYQSVGQLLRDYAAYKFPKYSKDEQVEKTDFLNYLLKRYHLYMTSPQSRHVQYWEKWCNVFFTKGRSLS